MSPRKINNTENTPARRKVAKRKALVTGGGGRMGRALSIELVRRGYEVLSLSHNKDFVHTMPSGVVPYVGDITDKKTLMNMCHGVDVVFHLAAVVSEYKEPTQRLMQINVQGTSNVLDACRQNGVGHIVFTSSIDVYGHARKDTLTEDSELKPADRYGYSKMMAEKEIEGYKDKIDYTILRIAAVYGKGFESSYFKLFKAIKEGKAYLIGSGNNHLSLIHIDDLVNALVLAAENKKQSANVYNIGDGVSYTQAGLFGMTADMLKVGRPTRHISPMIVNLVAKSRGLDSDELRFLTSDRVMSISKARKDLGFQPRVRIESAGLQMVGEFLSHNK